jgi:CHASE3 domain sensor protein/GAF domain-containing protein
MTMLNESPPDRSKGRASGPLLLRNLQIGTKLTIGFGVLVALTLVVVGLNYYASTNATVNIDRTDEVSVPTALTSARAQANLLRMLADVRGFLALGDPQYRESYQQVSQNFSDDLAELEQLSPKFSEENKQRIQTLRATFEEWSKWPDELFELRGDQLAREPAYRVLATDGSRNAGRVLLDLSTLISTQSQREATDANVTLLGDMARFQASFAATFSGLRGYVTTRNDVYKQEYEGNLELMLNHWETLQRKRDAMNTTQQEALDRIAENLDDFLTLPDSIIADLEGERWREDLYLFRTETTPLAEQMQELLLELTNDQQQQLQMNLAEGRQGLAQSNRQALVSGVVALLLGLGMGFIFRQNIAGPVRRLTGVAEQIRAGDLDVSATVESGDEIGAFAETFNRMTMQLRDNLIQIRKEKKRADDLLNVVIPIGVALSSEKDFNRLLGNMLHEAMQFCHADGGAIFLREEQSLRLVMMFHTSLNIAVGSDDEASKTSIKPTLELDHETDGRADVSVHVALTGDSVNIADVYGDDRFDFTGVQQFDARFERYRTLSLLGIPLTNSRKEVLGVLELFNAQDPDSGDFIPFDENLQQMMESFSSLAVAALESYIREQALRQEIQQLRIEIDETKRQQQVSEIVDTDFFQDLRTKARKLRRRSHEGQETEDG